MKRKIDFVINSMAGGGAERVLSTILRHSQSKLQNYEFRLLLIDDVEEHYQLPDWLEIVRLKSKGGFIDSIRRVDRAIGLHKPDLVVAFLTRANVAAVIAGRRRGIPVVISERINTATHLGNSASGRVAKGLVRAFYPRATRIISVSNGVNQGLLDHFAVAEARTRVINNPFDLTAIATSAEADVELPTPRPYIFAMGRLVEAKNFKLLIRAYAKSGVGDDLVIAGQGPLRDPLQRLVRELGLDGRVHFTGFVSNPAALARRAKLFVLSSNAEGFSNALVEAMAAGRPVISTDCPSGPSEILGAVAAPGIVTHADSGIIVSCNDVEAMAKAIVEMQDDAMRADYARRALERSRDFDVAPTVERYWAEFEAVLVEAGRPASAPAS